MDEGMEQVTSAGKWWHYKLLRGPSKYAFTWILSSARSVNCDSAWPSETWVCKEEIFISSFKWSFSPPQNRPAVERLSRFGAKAAWTSAYLGDTGRVSPTTSHHWHLLSDCTTDATDQINWLKSHREKVELTACQVGQSETQVIVFHDFYSRNI